MAYISSTFNTTNAVVKYRIVATLLSTNLINNTDEVNIQLQAWRTTFYSGGTFGSGSANIKLDQVTQVAQAIVPSQVINLNTYTVLYNANHTIQHNTDGTKRLNIGGYFTINSPVTSNPTWQHYEFDLPTIPRASSVTALNADIEAATTITINKAVSSFTHTLKYSFGTLNGTLVEKTDQSSWGWVIPSSFYAEIPNAASGICTITCETYDGTTLIGTKTTTFNVNVNQALNKPDVSATIVDDNAVTKLLTTNDDDFVKFFSDAAFVITATPKNSASIVSRKITCGAKTSTDTTGTLLDVESGIFVVETTDSRGFTGTVTYTKDLIPYVKLTNNPTLTRLDPVVNNLVHLELADNYFNGSFGDVANTLEYKYRYKEVGVGTWSSYIVIAPALLGNVYSYDANLDQAFDYEKAYDFELVATDKIYTTGITKTLLVKKGTPAFEAYADKFIHNTDLVVNGNFKMQNTSGVLKSIVDLFYDIGDIKMTIPNVNPSTRFPGTTWVAWGTGRVPVGVDTSQSEFNTVEKTGGAKTHRHPFRIGIPHYYGAAIGDNLNGGGAYKYSTAAFAGNTSQAPLTVGVNNNLTAALTARAVSLNISDGDTDLSSNLPLYITCYYWKRTA